MLNRKLSQYIFYGVLALITAGIFLIRFLVVGNVEDKIENMDNQNIQLQTRIEVLEETVQDNKDIQAAHLYELYDIIPNIYSGSELTYKVVSMLEELGVDESDDTQRSVFIENSPSFTTDTKFEEIAQEYNVVKVTVFFTTTDSEVVNNFIDDIYNDEQLFIITNLNYSVPEEGDYVTVQVDFIAIYDVEEIEES